MLKDHARFDLVAHFPSATKARTAEDVFGGRMEQSAPITFGAASRAGLLTGLILGAAMGYLISRNILSVGPFPSPMGPHLPLVVAFWAAILGASGWILGGTYSLFSRSTGVDRFVLHVTVQAEKVDEMKRLLTAEGATAVTVGEPGEPATHVRTPAPGL